MEERKKPDPEPGEEGYSSRDLEQFARLSAITPGRGAIEAETGGAGPAPANGAAFDYSEDDTRLFSGLMDGLSQARTVRGATPPSRKHDYTAHDSELFKELMAPERFATNGATAPQGAGPSSDPADAVSYTASDAAAFARIMPEESSGEETSGTKEGWLSSRQDRDVGTIRVVDFGEQQARPKRRERSNGGAIKVKFFD